MWTIDASSEFLPGLGDKLPIVDKLYIRPIGFKQPLIGLMPKPSSIFPSLLIITSVELVVRVIH